MSARDRLGECVERLGRRLGMPALALDANGICAIDVEGRLLLHLFADPGAETAVLYIPLGPLPGDGEAAMHRSMLEANARDGLPGALAIDPRTGEAMLVRYDPIELDDAAFERLLERMIAAGLAWTERLARGIDTAPAEGVAGGGFPIGAACAFRGGEAWR
ncbi:MAG: CesT family type III secretion system chaperone [Dongiaceae bacterium]